MDASLLQELQELEMYDVALTATIEADGTLRPVDGMWDKLGTQAMDLVHRGLLRTVVVAAAQYDVPSQYLDDESQTLRVIQAHSVTDAINKLNQQALPKRLIRQHELQACDQLDILGHHVPLKTHYQVCPLLHEIKRDRLPHNPRNRDGQRDGEERSLPHDHIQRWEEELRAEQVSYEQVQIQQVFEDFQAIIKNPRSHVFSVPHFVVLGPPGSGKTSLEQYLAWLAARKDLYLDGHDLVPARIRLRDWERWAVKEQQFGLPDYLAKKYRDLVGEKSPSAERWMRWIGRGDVLLLFDGLDELTGNKTFTESLTASLKACKKTPIVLTCRTVSKDLYKSVCPDFPVFTLDGLVDQQRDQYIHLYPAENKERYDAEALIRFLNNATSMRPLAANPLLLSILCFLIDDKQGVSLPATRIELYDQAINKLLSRERGAAAFIRGAVNRLPLMRRRHILESAALQLYVDSHEKRDLLFGQTRLLKALDQSIQNEGIKNYADITDQLIEEYTQESGILCANGEQSYFFLHPTIHEFLAASAIARISNSHKGFEAQIYLSDKLVNVQELLDKKAWSASWNEVFALLIGQLTHPDRLLKLLTDNNRDDYFRHRLMLAARCLPELRPPLSPSVEKLRDHITSDIIANVESPPANIWAALWQANGKIDGASFREKIADLLVKEELGAKNIIRAIGSYAATPQFLNRLEDLLRDKKGTRVRRSVARVIRNLGPTAATPVMLIRLGDMLQDDDNEIRRTAAETIKSFGTAAITPEFLARLRNIFLSSGNEVRRVVKDLIRGLGEVAATEGFLLWLRKLTSEKDDEVQRFTSHLVASLESLTAPNREAVSKSPHTPIMVKPLEDVDSKSGVALQNDKAETKISDLTSQHLIKLLLDSNQQKRDSAVVAIRKLGENAATPAFLFSLQELLQNSKAEVRCSAAEAVEGIGRAAATQGILSSLTHLLHDSNDAVREAAAEAVEVFGSAAATPDFLLSLTDLLWNDNSEIRSCVAEIIVNIGEVAATPEILVCLADLLETDDGGLQCYAARCVAGLGSAAATPRILARLGRLLGDNEFEVRDFVADAIKRIGPAAATPPFLYCLEELLQREGDEIRCYAADAVKSLEGAPVTEKIWSQLGELLMSEGDAVRRSASDAVKSLGVARATPAFLAQLGGQLTQGDTKLQGYATYTVKNLGMLGWRFFARKKRFWFTGKTTWEVKHVSELAQI